MKHAGILRLPTLENSTLLGIQTTHLLLSNSHCSLQSVMAVLTTVPKIHLTIVLLAVEFVDTLIFLSLSFTFPLGSTFSAFGLTTLLCSFAVSFSTTFPSSFHRFSCC